MTFELLSPTEAGKHIPASMCDVTLPSCNMHDDGSGCRFWLAADLDVREREAAVRGLRPGVPGAGVPQCELRPPDAVPTAGRAQRGVTTYRSF